jgi:Icc protein
MSANPSAAIFTVVQISDCHLGENPGEQLLGMDADQSLNDVLALIAAEQPQLDLLIVSGDLANHGSELAYLRLQHYLQRPLPIKIAPIFYLPGNHDDINLLRDNLSVTEFPSRTVVGDWQIIGLNSAVPKQVGGALDAEQFHVLEKLLTAHTHPTLLVLHHPPLPINCAWLDPQRVSNGDALLALVSAYPQVKAVLCGHVHQDNRFDYQHLPIYTTPSTCIQFLPRSDEFALDDLNPGYRWFKLFSDGKFETGVSRVGGHYAIDHNAAGY